MGLSLQRKLLFAAVTAGRSWAWAARRAAGGPGASELGGSGQPERGHDGAPEPPMGSRTGRASGTSTRPP